MINFIRRGAGRPLLLVHGLGGSLGSWDVLVDDLAREREVVAFDLPGHGASPAEADSGTFAGVVRATERFIADQGLAGCDLVGSSMGGRIVLELARKGGVGAVVALDPGGFWNRGEAEYLRATMGASIAVLRMLRPMLGTLARNAAGRTALLAQLSARPWALDGGSVADELDSFVRSSSFDALLHDLANGPVQEGPATASGRPLVIGWGRQDRLCLPQQALRAAAAFPSAELYWFESCGHFPMWDQREETLALILAATK